MQKNKTDVVKAVCNSAAKKLVVLGLAVAVSGGAVVSAQKPERDAKKQLSAMSSLERLIETNGDEEKRQILNALNSNIEDIKARSNMLERQAEEKKRQAEEKQRQVEEKTRQVEEKQRQAEEKQRQAEEKKRQAEENQRRGKRIAYWTIRDFLRSEIHGLREEINGLQEEIRGLLLERSGLQDEIIDLCNETINLQVELNNLLRRRRDLMNELEEEIPEAQRAQAELMDLATDMARNQNRPVETVAPEFFANIGLPQGTIQNIMRLFGYETPQQNQQPRYFGRMLNPFNWGLFGGSQK